MSCRHILVGNKQIKVDSIDSAFDRFHPYLHMTLSNFESAFVQELGNPLSVFSGYSVVIRTMNVPPVQATPVQLQQGEFFDVCNKVNALMATGHLGYSNSPWSANPFVFTNQTTGLQELGVNYCSLNNITLDEDYSTPTCEDVLHSIGYSECFSLIVLKDGFKQLALDEQSKKKTAFAIPGVQGKFEWNVLPSNLKNAQVHLQRAVDYCLGGLDQSQFSVYLGQILVHSTDPNQHLNMLALILNRLVTSNLRFDINQCIFMCSSLTFLGMELSKAGVAIGTEKLQRIAQFPLPNNKTELQSFLGLIGQYRRYVADYENLVQPLLRLVGRNEFYINNLNAKERWAFNELKARYQNAKPIPLRNPQANYPNNSNHSQLSNSNANHSNLNHSQMNNSNQNHSLPNHSLPNHSLPNHSNLNHSLPNHANLNHSYLNHSNLGHSLPNYQLLNAQYLNQVQLMNHPQLNGQFANHPNLNGQYANQAMWFYSQ